MALDFVIPDQGRVGDYDLIEKIAEGGMGTVYKGRHNGTGQMVAIKIVPPHLLAHPVYRRRFEKEYEAAHALDHPNIVRALDFGRDPAQPYLVMEYVEGESLGQRLERIGKLPEAEAIRIISQVAQGLHKAHKVGLVHRDVKPDNILLTPDGQAKLTDMGLVKEIDSEINLTRTGRGLGTPHFMAPEQFRRAKDADARCDIYSMAATLYMTVTGQLPFRSCSPLDAWMRKINNEIEPPRQLNPDLTERLDWAIRRSMSADPSQRAGSCREFIEDLTGHSTRRISAVNTISQDEDLWFMVYKDEDGVVHTVKGSTIGIRRSLRDGVLGDASHIRVSRSKQGPFEPIRQQPEFRDLVVDLVGRPPGVTPPLPSVPSAPPPEKAPLPPTPSFPDEAPRPVPGRSRLELPPHIPLAPSGRTGMVQAASGTALPQPPLDAPHFDLGPTHHSSEWLKWVLLLASAAAVGLAGYLLMPTLLRLRLF